MPALMIDSLQKLHMYLHNAMRIEHATIPPYLLALYSIRPSTRPDGTVTNMDAQQVIRVVVVEEMLHLTLAANLLNSVGGKPDLTRAEFVPIYPAYLPDGEDDFQVDLRGFSEAAVDTFLKIERPTPAPSHDKRLVRTTKSHAQMLATCPMDPQVRYYSIGEFYEEILRGFDFLYKRLGDGLFCGDAAKQIGPEYFYSGGGELLKVTNMGSACSAIRLIVEQGEGFGGGIYNEEHELAHMYRFDQLKLRRFYQKGDTAGTPTGPELPVVWEDAYPITTNAKLADYPEGSETYGAVAAFNERYKKFLGTLTDAYNGKPEILKDKAIPEMFSLRGLINQIIRNPMPGSPGVNAAPSFEMAPVAAEVTA